MMFEPSHPTVMSISADDFNPFSGDGIFSGGAGDRGRAASNAKKGAKKWEDLEGWYNQNPVTTQFGVSFDPFNQDTNTLHGLQEGPMETAVSERWLDPTAASAKGLQGASAFDPRMFDGGSNWGSAASAYDSRAPSAYDDMSSAFDPLGSAFNDVAYDEAARARMEQGGDYFSDLSQSGSDPIAEADFARRTAAAEGSRRANTDAALAQLEQRGQGNANAGLLADLSNQQASVSDQYLAGLDANAMAASRRDSAANRGAEIGQMIGSERRALDTTRAQGLDTAAATRAQGLDTAAATRAQGQDAYSNQNASGQDSFATSRNQGLDDFATTRMQGMDDWAQNAYDDYYGVSERNAGRQESANQRNIDHARTVSATNNDLLNNAAMYNAGQRQQDFQNRTGLATGASNAYGGVANTYQANSQAPGQLGPQNFFQAASNITMSAAGKPRGGG